MAGFCLENRDLCGILQKKVFEGPRHVVVDLTNKCNANCLACWTYSPLLQKESRPPAKWYHQEIEIGAFYRFVKDYKRMGGRLIRFTGGGEPLVHPQFLKAVEAVKKEGLWLALTTNGIFLQKFVKPLIDLGIDEIAISLWAGSERVYKTLHPSSAPGTYWNILETVRAIRSLTTDLPISFLHVMNAYNYQELERMVDVAQSLGVGNIYFTLVDAMKETKELILDSFQREEALLSVQRLKHRYSILERIIHADNLEGFEVRLQDVEKDCVYDRQLIDSLPCYMGWHFARILATGEVVPCCRGVHYPMGNIHEFPFEKIWRGDLWEEFRHLALSEKKNHPYFRKMNCYQMCDNLMHNQKIHRRILDLSVEQKSKLLSFNECVFGD